MKSNFIALICAVLLPLAGAAHAEQKLLVTDLLDAKQVELQTGYEYAFLHPSLAGGGSYSKIDYASVTTVGAGLGHGLQLDLSLRQVFKERDLEPAGVETRSGVGDLSTTLSYLLTREKSHLAVVGGVGIKFDSAGAGNGGTGSTDVSPFLAASWELEGGYIPYGSYRAILRSNGASDSHEVTIGVEKQVAPRFTLDVKGIASYGTGSPERTAAEDYTVEIGSYINLVHNLYLIPSLGYLQQSRHTVGDIEQQSVAGITTGLALYYFFE